MSLTAALLRRRIERQPTPALLKMAQRLVNRLPEGSRKAKLQAQLKQVEELPPEEKYKEMYRRVIIALIILLLLGLALGAAWALALTPRR